MKTHLYQSALEDLRSFSLDLIALKMLVSQVPIASTFLKLEVKVATQKEKNKQTNKTITMKTM